MIKTKDIKKVISLLQQYLYPGYFSKYIISQNKLNRKLKVLLTKLNIKDVDIKNYLVKIEKIKKALQNDLEEFIKNDPAVSSKDEVIITYPGFYAIMVYRLSHELYLMNYKLQARIMSELAHSKTGIDIHPGAVIGNNFFIDHGTGIVIGETTIIGNFVKIYQGVTLGAVSLNNVPTLKKTKRHPTIGDNVTIYASASILGGSTIIGKNAIIGSNVFITTSIEENKIVKLDNKNYKISDIINKWVIMLKI